MAEQLAVYAELVEVLTSFKIAAFRRKADRKLGEFGELLLMQIKGQSRTKLNWKVEKV